MENFSFSVLQVVNVLQRQTKIPFPMFFVDLVKDDYSKTIFDITSILHTKIKVEEPHKRRDLSSAKIAKIMDTRALIVTIFHAMFDVAKIIFHPRATNQMTSHQHAHCAKETIPPTTVAVKSTSNYKRIASSPQHQAPKMYTLSLKKPAHR